MTRQLELFGVDYTVGLSDELLSLIAKKLSDSGSRPCVLIHCHIHALRLSRSEPAVAAALSANRTTVFFEGIGLKTAAFLLGRDRWPDFSGTDLVPAFLKSRQAAGLRVALVGAAPGTARRAIAKLPGNWELCELLNGYDDIADDRAALDRLSAARPQLVILGLGTPRQEATALRWSSSLPGSVIWCVGGLFDILSGDKPRAPRAVRRFRLEWLWRFALDPVGHWPRLIFGPLWLLKEVIVAKTRHATQVLHEGKRDGGDRRP